MGNGGQPINLLDQRRDQASLMARVFDVLCRRYDQPTALAVIADAVEADAVAAGKAFADQAPGGPSLAHFATVIKVLRCDGRGLDISDVALNSDQLTYTVTRCGYLDMYREMGIASELASLLSCHRDHAFATGYDQRLSLERPLTLGHGDDCCVFRYTWREAD